MSDRCSEVEKQLDDFKDAYVKNNKEFIALSFYVNETRDAIKDMRTAFDEYKREHQGKEEASKIEIMDEMKALRGEIKPYSDLSTTIRALIWFGKTLIVIGSAITSWFVIRKFLE